MFYNICLLLWSEILCLELKLIKLYSSVLIKFVGDRKTNQPNKTNNTNKYTGAP